MRTGGIFYFPWHRHQIEGTDGFYCLIQKTLASGVNGIAKVPKRKVFTEVGLELSNVQSPVDALTDSATAPPVLSLYWFNTVEPPYLKLKMYAISSEGALYRIWCGVSSLGDSGVKVV